MGDSPGRPWPAHLRTRRDRIAMRRSKPDPNAFYIAWQSFAIEHPELMVIRRGDMFSGSHPIVHAHPAYFVVQELGADLPSMYEMLNPVEAT